MTQLLLFNLKHFIQIIFLAEKPYINKKTNGWYVGFLPEMIDETLNKL